MTQEALKLALEALENAEYGDYDKKELNKAITAIKEALAQPEQDNTYTYASSLATAIWQKHYIKDSPKWKPLDTIDGVLTQIDNMTCGLVREKPAQPEQEPVAWLEPEWGEKICPEVGYEVTMTDDHPRDLCWIPLYAQPQRTWVGLTEDEIAELHHEIKVRLMGTYKTEDIYRAIEAKLKEKNGA